MAKRPSTTEIGPWRGIEERPGLCGPGAFEAAFNVTCDNGVIRKRKGRKRLTTSFVAAPAYVYWQHAVDFGEGELHDWHSLEFTDLTETLTDGSVGSRAVLTTFRCPTSSATPPNADGDDYDYLLVGCPFKFQAIQFSMGKAANTTPVTVTARFQYWNGKTFTDAAVYEDGTKSTASSFEQDGTMLLAATLPTDWKPEAPSPVAGGVSSTGTGSRFLPEMYWARLWFVSSSGNTPWSGNGCEIGEVRIALSSVIGTAHYSTDLRSAINGIIPFSPAPGKQQILVGMDDTAGQTPRLFEWLPRRDQFRTIALPPACSSGAGAHWHGVVSAGKLLLTNGQSPILVYGGDKCSVLQAHDGTDAPSRRYLPSPPRGKRLATYNGALYVGAIEGAPRTVAKSEYNSTIDIFNGFEMVGGANYWPTGDDFDVTAGDAMQPEGGEISGLAILGGKLLVGTHERFFFFDDSPSLVPGEGGHGCIAPQTMLGVGDSVIALGDRQVYRIFPPQFPGGPPIVKSIGDAISQTLAGLNNNSADGAVAVVSPANSQYRLEIPIDPSGRNRLGLIYNYADNTWCVWGGIPPFADVGKTVYSYTCPREIAAAAKISEPGEIESIITGDYSGQLWQEDEGESDDYVEVDASNPPEYVVRDIIAYVVTHRLGWNDPRIKLFREWHVTARAEGQVNLCAMQIIEGEDAISAFNANLVEAQGRQTTRSLSGDGLGPAAEDEAWFSISGTPTADNPSTHKARIDGTGAAVSRWPSREFRVFKFSLPNNFTALSPTLAQQGNMWQRGIRIVFYSRDPNSPFEIRGWTVEYDIEESTR